MSEVSMLGAINMAMARALQDDPRVVLLGEDIGVNGGVFRATDGLQERFGEDRVMDTPLAETVLAGMSVGLAAQGFRPVTEFQFMGFIYPALDQVINHAGRLRNRTRGRLSCPLVFRAPMGAGIHAPEHHSESTEAMFAHIPGIRVVIPSSPSRAYGLLLSAIHDPDPVMFFEPTRLYRASKEEVEDSGEGLPLDVCFILREGSDVTIVTWGASCEGNASRRHATRRRRDFRRSDRSRDHQPDRFRHHSRFGGKNRPARDRARSAAKLRRRRRNRGACRRTRAAVPAGAGRTRHRA